jgi:hypothetical protein
MPVFLFEALIFVSVGYVVYANIVEPAWNNRPLFPWFSKERTGVEAELRQTNEDAAVQALKAELEANRLRMARRLAESEEPTPTVVQEVPTVEVAETAAVGEPVVIKRSKPRERKSATPKTPVAKSRRRPSTKGTNYSTE